MPRALKNIIAVLSFVLAVLAAVVVAWRGDRASVGTPQKLRPDVMTIRNGYVSLSAARVQQGVVLFDAGQDAQGRALAALLHALNANEADVRDVFLTHAHGGHLAGVARLPHARIWAGQGDVALAQGEAAPDTLLGRLMAWFSQPPAVHVSNPLRRTVDVPVGGITDVRCFPLPGHTSGSYAYLYNRVLFVGDALNVADGELALQLALFDPHPAANRAALRSLAQALGTQQVDRICAAHGGCTEAGDGRAKLAAFVHALPDD